jgi:hypothetical protein
MLNVVMLNVMGPINMSVSDSFCHGTTFHLFTTIFLWIKLGSGIINRSELKSYLGQVFNSKLGHFATSGSKCMVCMQPLLKLKTWARACPVS